MSFTFTTKRLMSIVEEAVIHLAQMMDENPDLSTDNTRKAVDNWSTQLPHLGDKIRQMRQGGDASENDVIKMDAAKWIKTHQVEDVIDLLANKHNELVGYQQLIDLVGKQAYRDALRREAIELEENKISKVQMADLWNSMEKPALGGLRWNVEMISALIEESASGLP